MEEKLSFLRTMFWIFNPFGFSKYSKYGLMSGQSQSRGFTIKQSLSGLTVKTNDFDENQNSEYHRKNVIIYKLISILYFLFIFWQFIYQPEFFGFKDVVNSLLGRIASIFIYILLAIQTFLSIRKSWGINTVKWHATEHKVVCLLECGFPTTINNLRRMPRITGSCGTMPLSFLFSLGWLILMIIFLSPLVTSNIPTLPMPLMPLSVLIFLIFIILSWFIALIIQVIFFTAKPTEEQLNIGLEIAIKAQKIFKNIK